MLDLNKNSNFNYVFVLDLARNIVKKLRSDIQYIENFI